MTCPICARAEMAKADHYAHCRTCDYWMSDLEHDVASTAAPDSEYDLVSYEHTRRANYLAILSLLAKRHPAGSTLLELGCADGLFLELAREYNGYRPLGIEPNTKMMAGTSPVCARSRTVSIIMSSRYSWTSGTLRSRESTRSIGIRRVTSTHWQNRSAWPTVADRITSCVRGSSPMIDCSHT